MTIILNGETITIQVSTIADMLREKGYADMLVAVAVNNSFVPKSQHAQTTLSDGDTVDIVAPMQGG